VEPACDGDGGDLAESVGECSRFICVYRIFRAVAAFIMVVLAYWQAASEFLAPVARFVVLEDDGALVSWD
jgi:hypothetical protein